MALLSAPRRLRPETAAGSPADGSALRLHFPEDPCRAEVEDFIRGVYHGHYGATVRAFTPVLVSVADAAGEIVAAAGYRSPATGALYLERYLREPIEEELAWHAGRAPSRREVAEVGHLASSRPGGGRRLMLLLGPHLARQRFRWAVATLTQELRQMIGRLGIAPLALAAADPAALDDEALLWGSYYEHQPVVVAGEIQPALRRLSRRGFREQGLAA